MGTIVDPHVNLPTSTPTAAPLGRSHAPHVFPGLTTWQPLGPLYSVRPSIDGHTGSIGKGTEVYVIAGRVR
jgi:hypothetical protein